MDIVERLRDDTKYCQCSFMDIYKPIEMEAADEIERLRAALSEAIDGESNAGSQAWLDKIYPLLGEKE